MNLTTPSIITPVSNAKDPADVAADLRAIADLIEGNPHLATVIATAFTSPLWPNHAVAYDQRDNARGVMAETIRQLMPIATGPVEKRYHGDYFDAVIPLRSITIQLTDARDKVCTRVVTGVETVTEEIPDPEYLAAAPTVTQTREVETVEWRCEPLMAGQRDAGGE